MTWRELKNTINKWGRANEDFLDSDVKLYDFHTGDEFLVNITELLCGDDNNDSDNGWVPYLSINDIEDETNETETEETGID